MSELAITPLGPASGPSETWVLDLVSAAGPADLSTVPLPAGWQAVPHGTSQNGTALVASAGADELVLTAPGEARLRLLRHGWSGTAQLRGTVGAREIDLHREELGVAEIRVDGDLAEGVRTDPRDGARRVMGLAAWLAGVRAERPAAVGLVHPDWRGVRAATENHLTYVLAVPADPLREDRDALAEALAGAGVRTVVAGGLAPGHRSLVRALHARGVRCLVTWHGTLAQQAGADNAEALFANIALTREGVLQGFGFIKPGIAATFRRLGFPATTVANALRVPMAPPTPTPPTPQTVGIWSAGPVSHKAPHAMLAACAELEPVPQVRVVGARQGLGAYADLLRVPLTHPEGLVPATQMVAELARCDVNLYVTATEAAPMLPLESFAAGRICIVGPVATYPDDDEVLRTLMVPEIDRHDRIAEVMRRAYAERDDILAYVRESWWPAQQERARSSVRAFVGAGDDELI